MSKDSASRQERYWESPSAATRHKHSILHGYLDRWISILGGWDSRGEPSVLHYVDTHAGRGRHKDGTAGSPIIAIERGDKIYNDRDGSFVLKCYFVEKSQEAYASLEREVEQALNAHNSVEAETYCGDFRDHIKGILERIPRWQPAFIFVDPFGYREVTTGTLAEYLVGRCRAELFITVMDQYIARFASDKAKHRTLDNLFGDHRWREFIDHQSEVRGEMVDLYANLLQNEIEKQLGSEALIFVYPIKVSPSEPRQASYHLIHASQHRKARLEMENAVLRRKEGILGPASSPIPILASGDVEKLAYELATAKPGIRALELAEKVWFEHRYVTWRHGIRVAIKSLAEQQVLEVRTSSGRVRNASSLPIESDLIYPTGKALGGTQSSFF